MSVITEHKERVQAAMVGYFERQQGKALKEAGPNPDGTPKPKRKPSEIPTEWEEQRVLCEWLHVKQIVYFAVPNGGSRSSAIEGNRLRYIGVKAGVSDIIVVSRAPKFPGARAIAIELKRVTGGRLSPEQANWLQLFSECGWLSYCAHGANDAIDWLSRELGF